MTVFRNGDKSTEIVQAIMILTYWKEPHDNRVWTTLGYAIRVSMELDLHRLEPRSIRPNSADTKLLREARNLERTWLVLFVYDRRSVAPR
jgi:hypothetical protein